MQVVRREEPIHLRPDASSARRGAAILGATLPAFGSRTGPGCGSAWISVGPVAWICGDGVVAAGTFGLPSESRVSTGGLPYAYYFVNRMCLRVSRLATPKKEARAQLLPASASRCPRRREAARNPFGLTTHVFGAASRSEWP